MARISNVDKAFRSIESEAANCQVPLTKKVYQELLDDAAKEFNLDSAKVEQLKGMKFSLPAVEPVEIIEDTPIKLKTDAGEDKQVTDAPDKTVKPPVDLVLALFEKVENLELALAKIATLSGYSNYLSEFGLKPWKPGKKDINKNYG